jgi:hypothetical protein
MQPWVGTSTGAMHLSLGEASWQVTQGWDQPGAIPAFGTFSQYFVENRYAFYGGCPSSCVGKSQVDCGCAGTQAKTVFRLTSDTRYYYANMAVDFVPAEQCNASDVWGIAEVYTQSNGSTSYKGYSILRGYQFDWDLDRCILIPSYESYPVRSFWPGGNMKTPYGGFLMFGGGQTHYIVLSAGFNGQLGGLHQRTNTGLIVYPYY